MTYQQVAVEQDEGIFTLILNRPDRGNAFTQQMMEEILLALDEADADESVRAVVLTGAGKSFCVGADLAAGGSTFERGEDFRDRGGRVTLRLFNCLKPVVAAVNGAAVGVGASMILAADIRLAADSARFGYPFVRRGITVDGAASWFLPRIVGMSRALEWAMSGRVFDAAEAAAGGLVRAPMPLSDLTTAAREMAHSVTADSAPVSVAIVRQMMWRLAGAPHPMQAHIVESRSLAARGASEDAREGVSSFLERRRADFPLRVPTDLPEFFPWWDGEAFVPFAARGRGLGQT